jgi:hypothetical protein
MYGAATRQCHFRLKTIKWVTGQTIDPIKIRMNKKLYSLKISESTTSITCNTNDCQKKLDDIKKWGRDHHHQRCHKDVSNHCKEYIDGKKF